jgi:hypothetical protein
MFHVGQRVVCVDNSTSWSLPGNAPRLLRKGGLYTVQDIAFAPVLDEVFLYIFGPVGLALEGIDGWSPRRFRPIVPRETSIECFRALLAPSEKEPARGE